MRQPLILLLLLGGSTSLLSAQSPQQHRTWEFSVLVGRALGNAGKQLTDAMDDAGYNDTEFCIMSCRGSSPSEGGTRAWLMLFNVAATSRWGATFGASGFSQNVYGFKTTGLLSGEALDVRLQARTLGLTGTMTFGFLTIEAGPILIQTGSARAGIGESMQFDPARVGAAVGLRLAVPIKRRFLFDAAMRYHHAGESNAGPFSTPSGATEKVPLNFNHVFGGVGVGVRF